MLDKETLKEKDSFLSFIYADLDGYVSPTSGIHQEMINDAPKPAEVGKMIFKKFGSDIFIGSFVQNLDIEHLPFYFQQTLRESRLKIRLIDIQNVLSPNQCHQTSSL